VRMSPVIVTSPLLRRTIVIGLAKSLLGLLIGRRGVIWARHAKRSLLRAVGRDVQQAKRETKPI
jgi:hypothetical protein